MSVTIIMFARVWGWHPQQREGQLTVLDVNVKSDKDESVGTSFDNFPCIQPIFHHVSPI